MYAHKNSIRNIWKIFLLWNLLNKVIKKNTFVLNFSFVSTKPRGISFDIFSIIWKLKSNWIISGKMRPNGTFGRCSDRYALACLPESNASVQISASSKNLWNSLEFLLECPANHIPYFSFSMLLMFCPSYSIAFCYKKFKFKPQQLVLTTIIE